MTHLNFSMSFSIVQHDLHLNSPLRAHSKYTNIYPAKLPGVKLCTPAMAQYANRYPGYGNKRGFVCRCVLQGTEENTSSKARPYRKSPAQTTANL